MTLYDIKPKFQTLLRPSVTKLATRGITANQVTVFAALGSVVLGAILLRWSTHTWLFVLVPIWMFARMALNAMDGMLAREFNQKSHLGQFLNELCDVVSDWALIAPFLLIAPFTPLTVALVMLLAALSEMTGVIAQASGASRRYDGPLGKSDRALLLSIIALWLVIAGQLPEWAYWIMPITIVLLMVTVVNRVRRAIAEIK